MPKNADSYARSLRNRATRQEESFIEAADEVEKKVEVARMKAMLQRPSKNSKMYTLTQEIYELFDRLLDKPDFTKKIKARLPAHEFEYLRNHHSPPTIHKAKKLLGIHSVRVGHEWFWTVPINAPTEIQQTLLDKRIAAIRKDLLDDVVYKKKRPCVAHLEGEMEASEYECDSLVVQRNMNNLGYRRGSIIKAKSVIGIQSLKKEGGWVWIWPHQVVKDWLVEVLSDGPVIAEEIILRAQEEKGWSLDLVRLARETQGNIRLKFSKEVNKVVWYDINNPGPTQEEKDLESGKDTSDIV